MKTAIEFFKSLKIDLRCPRDEIKKALRLKYLDFLDQTKAQNTIDAYREYRAAVRGWYGFDLLTGPAP